MCSCFPLEQMRQTAYHVAESAEIRALLPEPEEYNSNIDDMLKEHRRTSKMVRLPRTLLRSLPCIPHDHPVSHIYMAF